MSFSTALQRRLLWIAGAGLITTLLGGLLVPIYTDEVGWRMQLARSPFDGGVDRALSDQCGANTSLAAPWFLQPLRHASAWIDAGFGDPRSLRLAGVVCALIALGLLAAIGRIVGADRRARTIAYALLGFGVLPWLLVWHRPEQPLLLAVAGAVLLALIATPKRAIVAADAILLLGVFALGQHPKAVVFMPIFVVAILLVDRARLTAPWRIAMAATLVILAAGAFTYWQARFACPDDPVIAAHNAQENLSAGRGRGFAQVAGALAGNVSPMGYVARLSPFQPQMSAWLPPSGWAEEPATAAFAVVLVVWQIALLAIAVALVLRLAAAWRRRTLDSATALAATIVACVLAWSALQSNKNAYECAFVLPLLVVAWLLLASALTERWARVLGVAAPILAATALLGEGMLLATYVPGLARAAVAPGELPHQPLSFVPWTYPAQRRDILAAGRACGIVPSSARYLLVDDLTYWPFIRSYRPFNRITVLDPWIPTARDPLGYLRAHGSSGIIMQCAALPADLRARARSVGQFCCVGPL